MLNSIKITLFSFLVVAMVSCKKDDDKATCNQADWVGTYTGTIDCDGSTEDVTVTIAANGTEALNIAYSTPTSSTEYTDPLTPEGCDLDLTSSDSGITLTIDANLDGDKLTFKEIYTILGGTTTCTIVATRK